MIEVRHLQKSFGTHSILDGVSFRIENGESVVIIGRSGGGKSVLLKHLIGLLQPDAGEVLIDGENIVADERTPVAARAPEIRHGVPGRGAVRFDDGGGKCGVRAAPA